MRYPADHPIEIARVGLAEQGPQAAGILADYLEEMEPYYPECGAIGRLLREWHIPTNVRMSNGTFADFNKMLNEVNESLGVEKSENLVTTNRGTVATLTDPLGPFYTTLTTSLNVLDANMHWLSQNPIRKLVISRASSSADSTLTSVLRNYRMTYIEHITLNGSFNNNLLVEAISGMNGACLDTLNIPYGVTDRSNKLATAFYLAERIRKGAVLKIGTRTITK